MPRYVLLRSARSRARCCSCSRVSTTSLIRPRRRVGASVEPQPLAVEAPLLVEHLEDALHHLLLLGLGIVLLAALRAAAVAVRAAGRLGVHRRLDVLGLLLVRRVLRLAALEREVQARLRL